MTFDAVAESPQFVGLESTAMLLPWLVVGRRLRDKATRSHEYDDSAGDPLELVDDPPSVGFVEMLDDIERCDDVERTGSEWHVPNVSLDNRVAPAAVLGSPQRWEVDVNTCGATIAKDPAAPAVRASNVKDPFSGLENPV